MPKTRLQKEEALTDLKQKFSDSKGVVFAKYMGLTVNEIQELRSNLKEENSEMIVSKKRLVALMLEDAGVAKEDIVPMEGAVAVIFGYSDEVAPAKVVAEFAKKHEFAGFHGGVLDGKVIDESAVIELSKLPSKIELLAKVVGTIKAPITGFVTVLGGNLRGLAQVLNQIKEQKDEQAK